jgi:hypothetical protein
MRGETRYSSLSGMRKKIKSLCPEPRSVELVVPDAKVEQGRDAGQSQPFETKSTVGYMREMTDQEVRSWLAEWRATRESAVQHLATHELAHQVVRRATRTDHN